MSKTVAFFNGFYLPHFGGVERYTYNIAQKLIAKGYNIIVVTTQHEEYLKEEEVVDGIKVYRLPIRNVWKNRYPFLKKNKEYRRTLEKIKSENIDYYIVNTRFYMTSILGASLASENGKEAMIIEHGTTYLTMNNPVVDFFLHQIERTLIQHIKKNTATFYGVSQEAANWLTEFGVESKGVVYNAIDSSDFDNYYSRLKDTSDKIIISYSGRLQAKFKGVETLLSAFSKLSQEVDHLELIIAGDGPIYKDMVAQYTQENIKFLGRVPHDKVMEINNKSDIFVLLSKIEGFSTAMLEAALLKNVVITTNVGGARELIPNENFGFIIENDETVLLDTLRSLVQDMDKIRRIQENVSQRVLENYTWDKTAESFVKAFEIL
ncbi:MULTISPECIES: glycosyltransferase family 4 protein [Lactococcus]|uniref:glycosyltransferase family 4 protein n=1 Tax=Lactococcus TaxID=1357 RepID=UPI001570D8EC|nr:MULTISPECIES: glycosyltransferase family 4 protein [Lactococcus]NSL25675.1 glycosyltransferase family 4 protein [Lactococcus petauri]QSR04594.1 glycosyltransferase family 4 protein [Lactococcus sp. LG1267]